MQRAERSIGAQGALKLLSMAFVALLAIDGTCNGQSSRSDRRRREEPEVVPPAVLEKRTRDAELSLLTEYMEVAEQYYQQDDLPAAVALLQRIRKLDPELPGLKQKIDDLNEEILQDNPNEFELDTSRGWGNPVAVVEKGRRFRVVAAGSYKVSMTANPDVTGLPADDISTDYSPAVPFGALMGIVMKDNKPGKPFRIGAKSEITPEDSGRLFLRVNVPSGARCTGKLKILITGATGPVR